MNGLTDEQEYAIRRDIRDNCIDTPMGVEFNYPVNTFVKRANMIAGIDDPEDKRTRKIVNDEINTLRMDAKTRIIVGDILYTDTPNEIRDNNGVTDRMKGTDPLVTIGGRLIYC